MSPDRDGADERLTLQASITDRLRRAAQQDLAPVLEPQAIQEAQRLAALPPGDDDDLQTKFLLGWLHWYRYQALGEDRGRSDLHGAILLLAICFLAGANDLPKPLLPALAEQAITPAVRLLEEAVRTPEAHLISAVSELWQRIVDATPINDPDRPWRLSELGTALRIRFERTEELANLNAAIDSYKQAVEQVPVSYPAVALVAILANLGNMLVTRFWRTGLLNDLNAAVDFYQQTKGAVPADHSDPHILSNLGNALRIRFEHTGELGDLDEAVQVGREASAATAHPDPGILSNLGNALQARFGRMGALADLDEAVQVGQQAVQAAPTGHPDRAAFLSSLGNAFLSRFGRTGILADLDAAVVSLEQAADAAPPGSLHWGMYLSNLGIALRSRFERTHVEADLDAALCTLTQAVEATPADNPNRAGYLSNVGAALYSRYEQTAALADLEAAIGSFEKAVAAGPSDHPEHARYLSYLGGMLKARFERTGSSADMTTAVNCFAQATEIELAPPSVRIEAAHQASLLLADGEPGRAARLLDRAVRLLPETVPPWLNRADRQYTLGRLTWLAADAASLALRDPDTPEHERPAAALGLLEIGRAVLLTQALETRSDLTDLREQHPLLAAAFVRLRDLLDQASIPVPTNSPAHATDVASGSTDVIHYRRQLADEWTALLKQIRALHGFARFALPPSAADIVDQAANGPVVVFNISHHRSDALVVTTSGITCLPLPGLAYKTVIDQASTFYEALGIARTASRVADRITAQAKLSKVLAWLWDHCTGPVLEYLEFDRPGPASKEAADEAWPRIWWAAGGILGLLPIHAAGYHSNPPDPLARTVIDRVISSYTPTIRALRYTRERLTTAGAGNTGSPALIVAMPTTPHIHGRLEYVPEETQRVASRLPGSILLAEPGSLNPGRDVGLAPTCSTVLDLLPTARIAHFACHAESHPSDPSQSRLLLHDHDTYPLTVNALARIRLEHAQLAYLSACETALSFSTELIGEAIHLTSAFQLIGYPHVIGTMWDVNDQIAADIADAFYTTLTNSGEVDVHRAAHALHHAIRTTRDRFPRALSLWAAHIHAGA